MQQKDGIGPGTTVQCGRRWATVGALVSYRGMLHALTVAHIFCAIRKKRVEFPGSMGGGWVAACVPLRRLGIHSSDGALIALDEDVAIYPDHPVVGPLLGHLSRIQPGIHVILQGSSGMSCGQVVQSSWSGRVRYPWGSRRLSGQVLIEINEGPLPHPGDSGSLWVTENGLAVGLQVAVARRLAIVSPLDPLLSRWNAHLLRSKVVLSLR